MCDVPIHVSWQLQAPQYVLLQDMGGPGEARVTRTALCESPGVCVQHLLLSGSFSKQRVHLLAWLSPSMTTWPPGRPLCLYRCA